MQPRASTTLAILMISMVLAGSADSDWPTAVEAFRSGDYQAAATGFSEVIETNPEFAGAHYMLGLCWKELDDLPAAVQSLATASELAPDDLDTTLAYAQVLMRTGEADAVYTLLGAVALDTVPAAKRTPTIAMLAKAAIDTGHAAEVVDVLREAAQANTARASIHTLLGAALEATGDNHGAAAAFAEASTIDPTDLFAGRGAVRTSLAVFRQQEDGAARQNIGASALTTARALVATEATHEHLLLAGEAALAAKAYDTAVTWFSTAHTLEPHDEITHLYLGQSLYATGQLDEAQRQLEALRTTASSEDIDRRACKVLAKIAEKNLALQRAAELHRCAGDTERAAMIADLAKRFSEALDERDRLLGDIADSRRITADLIEINELEPARKMETRVATLEAQVADIDRNLEEVKAALR